MARGYLAAKVDERQRLTTSISGIYERAAADGERDLNESEQTQVREMETRAASLDDMIERYQQTASGAQKFMSLSGTVRETEERAAVERARAEAEASAVETRQSRQTFGTQVVESPEFGAYRGRGAMAPVTIEGYVPEYHRAAITTEDLDIPATQWVGPRQPGLASPMLSVCARVQTSSGSVEYVTWSEVSDAAVVAEGAVKPEATFEPVSNIAQLVTIAHWRAITRQAIEDVPQIRSTVDGLLRRGVVQKLEADATAALTGSTDIPVVSASDGLLAGIRSAIGEVQSQGYTPDALVLNPQDYAALDVDVMTGTNNGPVRSQSFWGLTPVPSNSITQGTAYVGEFGTGLTWFDRGSTDVLITDSHADYFVRNMLVLLAETRAAFAVTEPRALATVTAGS